MARRPDELAFVKQAERAISARSWKGVPTVSILSPYMMFKAQDLMADNFNEADLVYSFVRSGPLPGEASIKPAVQRALDAILLFPVHRS